MPIDAVATIAAKLFRACSPHNARLFAIADMITASEIETANSRQGVGCIQLGERT
jgi:hypothetical protein